MNDTFRPDPRRFGARRWLAAALLVAGPAFAYAQIPKPETRNKQLIRQAFARWADGSGNFFDLLAEDVQWTITGSSAYSKTYTSKKQFLDEAATPLNVRLANPIVPTVRNLYADGDVVVAIWDGAPTATDGQPYRNTYSWAMTLKNGRITHVTAFLDLIPYLEIFRRIPNPR